MDGLLMNTLMIRSMKVAAVTIACTVAISVRAADISLPPDPSARDARTLVSFACSKCHGYTGNGVSVSPLIPILAGQNQVYLETQLKLLRQHGRSDPHARAFMWGITHALTDEQIAGLAEYFSKQPAVTGHPSKNPALAAKGKEIYENGVKEPKVVKCAQCHGEVGAGTNIVPRLQGQHPGYLALQVHYYHDKLRENVLMQRNVANITPEQTAAVVEYISTLTGEEPPDDDTPAMPAASK